MAVRFLVNHKRILLLSLTVIILLSFLACNEEDPAIAKYGQSGENAIIFSQSTDVSRMEIVDEINTIVFHAVIMRRISCRQVIRLIRLFLLPILAAVIAASLYLIACRQKPHQFHGRIVLIRYIHRSDGKK